MIGNHIDFLGGELRDALYEQYPDAYGSVETLWSATIDRWYEDIPGFDKPEYGMYAFNPDELPGEV